MSANLDRRELLKLSGLALLAAGLPLPRIGQPTREAAPGSPNILVIVFDAFSAGHLVGSGYPRETTPFLNRFMQNATVYRNHFAAGPYTTPSTASLFTGVMPWEHRAYQLQQTTTAYYHEHNLFTEFQALGYQTIAYSHNPYVNILFDSMQGGIEGYKPGGELMLSELPALLQVAQRDFNNALRAFDRTFKRDGLINSLIGGQLLKNFGEIKSSEVLYWEQFFPAGLPNLGNDNTYFVMEDAVDWLQSALPAFNTPYLGYFHFWPPHYPYRTRGEFQNRFRGDDFRPPEKPEHRLTQGYDHPEMFAARRDYDEYLLYVDAEFERLISGLEAQNGLENTWIVFTSDHGELFERGFWGHRNLSLHQPVVNIPLVVKAPGQVAGVQVDAPTSIMDLLPGLLAMAGGSSPGWAEGLQLPTDADSADSERELFIFNPIRSDRMQALEKGIAAVVRGRYKLIWWFGLDELEGGELVELYDLQEDPEELVDLADMQSALAAALLEELRERIADA